MIYNGFGEIHWRNGSSKEAIHQVLQSGDFVGQFGDSFDITLKPLFNSVDLL